MDHSWFLFYKLIIHKNVNKDLAEKKCLDEAAIVELFGMFSREKHVHLKYQQSNNAATQTLKLNIVREGCQL